MRSHFLLVALLALAGCAHTGSPTAKLEAAARDAQSGSANERTLALAGFHALLMENDVKAAQSRFDQALEKGKSEPYALVGQALMAQRASNSAKGLQAALDLCERAPKHPLAAAGARLVFDLAGRSKTFDDAIVERVPKLLQGGVHGDAASLLRGALATIALARADDTARDQVMKDLGVPTEWSLLGPFSAFHLLELEQPTGVEASGVIENAKGPFGDVPVRTLKTADGRISLAPEPVYGDVFVLVTDVTVAQSGSYVVRAVTSMDHALVVDGTTVATRRTWEKTASTVTEREVKLSAGTHRVLFRVARDEQQGALFVTFSRVDGQPAGVTAKAARGAAPSGWSAKSVSHDDVPRGYYPSAQSMYQALESEAGPALAALLAAQDSISRDRDGAKALLAELPDTFGGATRRFLAAELHFADRTVGSKVARGRGTRELEAAIELDHHHTAALLASAQLALDDGRHLDALELINQARAEAPSAAASLLQSRVELALGVDARADQSAQEAEKLLPGLCEALAVRADLAARRDAIADADALFTQLQGCSNASVRQAEHLKSRGDGSGAIARFERLLADDESNVPTVNALTALYVSQKRFDDAVKLLERTRQVWPRSAHLLKVLGDVHERAGNAAKALEAREAALLIDGADLPLRRIVERTRTGKEVLAEHAITTDEALKAYQAAPGDEDAPGAYVLDAAAVRVYPDGSQVDRIHIIQKALDQSGLQDIAEVEVPPGAYILKMRTLKADGTVLEPESIEGKDSISLPGVQPGDFVEYEYLMAHPSRGPAQPGFTASSFYFQIARQPNNWSTYKVFAPKGTGLKVDAHNMDSPPPKVIGDEEAYVHEERRVAPYIPEPNGPPSGNEWLPFVQVGAGQNGNEGVVTAYADAFVDLGQVTYEVKRFATEAVAGKTGRDAAVAYYAAVMKKLTGRDAGLQISAASSVAQDRGSRLMLLYAGYKALGFPVRVAVVHTFNADPAPYLFPNEGLLPYLCVRVTLPDGSFAWLDPIFRYGPFGELPDLAGDADAMLLPEPGKKLEKVRTPKSNPSAKRIDLQMSLNEEGVLSGSGVETYVGFGAAQLAEALESLSSDQRTQALQSALSRYFGGAEMSKLEIEMKREVGAPVVVRYTFTAPRFARPEGDGKLVMGPLTFPVMLGRRYLQLGSRRTPLFLDSVEEASTTVKLQLPTGYSLVEPMAELKSTCPWGRFVHKESVSGSSVTVEESYRVEMARVPPQKYLEFGTFAGEVDLVQGRDLLAEKK